MSEIFRQSLWRYVALVACSVIFSVSSARAQGAVSRFWSPLFFEGNWFEGEKWAPTGVPQTVDRVFLTQPGTYHVTLDQDAQVDSLTVGTPAGMQALSVVGATLQLDVMGSVQSSGILNASDATILGTLANHATLRLDNSTVEMLSQNGGLLEVIDSQGTLGGWGQNTAQGTIRIVAESVPASLLFASGGGEQTLNSHGLIELNSNSQPVSLDLANDILINEPTGTIVLDAEPGSATVTARILRNNGLLMGNGEFHSNLINGGEVVLGDSSGQLLVTEDYVQSPAASLTLGISGPTPVSDYGQLTINKLGSLAGVLSVNFEQGFVPSPDDEFTIITRNGGGGVFQLIRVNGLPGHRFEIDYQTDAVTMTFTDEDVLQGDYNGNGLVEQADLDMVLLNWGVQGPTPAFWINDLPDDTIDQNELDRVLLNWGKSAEQMLTAAGVPEPASWLMAFGLVAILFVRRIRLRLSPINSDADVVKRMRPCCNAKTA